ncbi:hypothetical protein Nepgr_005019 [Nepenthes gracilis]|uniref:BHLH domain-containing protein n=1 Tax=Nepenthes gracilis TaxID=150966 RepID=A0AAD3XFX3_NEPGR|nr:hypothetical protein Nepgr_005019 [Nepenthes gracilis]
MESLGTLLDGEWESICKMLSTDEPDFPAHFLGNYSLPKTQDSALDLETPSILTHDQDNAAASFFHGVACFSPDALTRKPNYFSQESSHDYNLNENWYLEGSNNQLVLPDDHFSSSMEFCVMDQGENGGYSDPLYFQGMIMNESIPMNEASSSPRTDNADDNESALASFGNQIQLKRKAGRPEMEAETEEKTSSLAKPKKRALISRDGQKRKGKTQSNNKDQTEEEETNNGGSNGQSSGCDVSDDESNASREVTDGENSVAKQAPTALNVNGKKRASRGAATDPQSLYARRRRERINERLRILQNLVPNGTKVDISTMLEEAVHYVKFLQLQIKLLSSDELWMFAPLAYNGIDVGLYRKLSPFLLGP